MNRKIMGIISALTIMTMLATPVMAIGPDNAAEVGKNKNLNGFGGLGVINDNPSGNTILWGAQGRILLSMIASRGEGRINNAIIANMATLSAMSNNPDYVNKWIYLSGDGGTNIEQFAFTAGPYAALGSHGMLFWFTLFTFGSLEAAQSDALEHPNGVYIQIIVTG